MLENQNINLKEDTNHGNGSFPIAKYEWHGDSDYDVSLHWHKETEIIYLEKGTFTLKINLESYEITGPAYVIVGSGEIHSIELRKDQLENAIVFDLNMISYEYIDALQYKLIQPLLTQRIFFPRLITPNDSIWEEMNTLYHTMYDSVGRENIHTYFHCKIALYQLISCFYDHNYFRNYEIKQSDNYKIEIIKRIFLYIHEHYQQKMTLSELADVAGMNEQYFCRYFKQMTGKTVTEYINELRIEKAAVFLIETSLKILDIAIMCGYDNIGYFNKRFTLAKGMTPSEYRVLNKKSK